MKTKLESARLYAIMLMALFLTTWSIEVLAQEQEAAAVPQFKITIERTDNGLRLQSQQGSAWKELSFSLSDNQVQAVDEFGMAEPEESNAARDNSYADYLFTITKTKDGLLLTGMEGTVWTKLSFSLPANGKQTIDRLGMVE
jgi:hypothetical protein